MRMMYDAAPISGVRKTADGYLVADVRVARAGIYTYLGREVDPDGSLGVRDRQSVRVWRPEEEVFSADSLTTYAHRPITNNHPSEMVDASNWRKLAIGSTGDEVVRDGEWVRVPMLIMDGSSIDDVEGGKRQLSMGYTCTFDATPGTAPDGSQYDVVQRNMRMNHLAVVAAARAGAGARIGDREGVEPSIKKEDTMSNENKTVVLGDKAVQVAVGDVSTVESYKAEVAKKISDMQTAHDTEIAKRDTTIGELRADLKKAQDAALKPEDVSKMVADRVALEATVRAVDSKIVTDGKTDAQLRREAVVAALGESVVGDASEAEISGMFRAVSADAKATDTSNTTLRTALSDTRSVADAQRSADEAYDKSVANLNAHRNK